MIFDRIAAALGNCRAAAGDWLDRWYEELPWRARVALGRRGEQIAARYLRRRGWRVIGRNFSAAGAEIDLIALDRATLVFVEVKTRIDGETWTPAAAVDARKRERIRRAASVYLRRHRADNRPVRFDVVAISSAGRARRIELLKDSF